MRRRSPARYLAPIALAATITGTYLIVHHWVIDKHTTTQSHVSTTRTQPVRRGKFAKAKFYVVRPGDTLSSIALKTGVPVKTLEALNRKVTDPNSLQTAQRLRLRR